MTGHERFHWRWLLLIPVLMFGFGFALVPMYDVFCRVTGLNGKVNTSPLAVSSTAEAKTVTPASRQVHVQFITHNNASMSWQFMPLGEQTVDVMTGTDYRAYFRVKNPTTGLMTARAVPSISPAEAAQYFHKVQCFCFNEQKLESGEQLDMPVIFTVDKDLPAHIHTITLAYTLFDTTQLANR